MYTRFVINCSDQSGCSEFQNSEIGSVRLSVGLCRNRSSVDFVISKKDRGFLKRTGFLIKGRGFSEKDRGFLKRTGFLKKTGVF